MFDEPGMGFYKNVPINVNFAQGVIIGIFENSTRGFSWQSAAPLDALIAGYSKILGQILCSVRSPVKIDRKLDAK